MLKQHRGKVIIIAIIAVFAAAFYYANQAAKQANEGVVITDHIKGNPEASVTLVEYSDFQCPACAAAAPVVNDVLARYGEHIRFEYRHFPLVTIHPLAIPAARAAEAAGQQGKFWEMHDMLFENQQTWSTAPNPSMLFITYAEDIGLDMTLYRQHLDSSLLEDRIRAQFAEAREQGFTGTPTFVLNGTKIEFTTYDDFVAQIDAAVQAVNGTTATTSVEAAEQIDLEFAL